MPEFFFMMIFTVVFYSLMAYTLFSTNPDDNYFRDIFESFISIFVLQTTANYPDVTIPAVRASPMASLFFISFLMIQLYFIFNLNIATVFNNYKEELETKKLSLYIRKRIAMVAAFRMLDYENHGYIDRKTWTNLFLTLRPYSTETKALQKFEKEDPSSAGKIDMLHFFHLSDIILTKVKKPISKRERTAANWFTFPRIKKIVEHGYIVILLLTIA